MPNKKKKAAKVKQGIFLDVGCGNNCQPGYVGMDKRPLEKVQIVHDAELFPWPLDPDSCEVIMLSHLIEHIKPWLQIDFMNECWRVLKMGGVLMIATPHGLSFGYTQDPTHCSPWNEATPQYFTPGAMLYEIYRPKPWKLEKISYDKKRNLEVAFRKITETQSEGVENDKKKK